MAAVSTGHAIVGTRGPRPRSAFAVRQWWLLPLSGVLAIVIIAQFVPPGLIAKSIVDLIFGPAETATGGHSHSTESRPGTIIEPVSSEPLVQIPGLNMIVARVKFPPGALSPKHNHPGSVYVYVLEGEIVSQLLGGPPASFGPGQSFFEPPGTVHLFAENPSQLQAAEVLAVFIAPPGVPLVSYLD